MVVLAKGLGLLARGAVRAKGAVSSSVMTSKLLVKWAGRLLISGVIPGSSSTTMGLNHASLVILLVILIAMVNGKRKKMTGSQRDLHRI